MKKTLFFFSLFLGCFFPVLAYAAPAVTVSASAVTLLGTTQSISITVTLIDPNSTGMLRVSGTGIVPVTVSSTVTPGTTATVGPIYGNDVIIDGFGNINGTYYKVQVFTVTGNIIASTPSLQNFYAFTGSGTIDLATATPLAPSFMTGTAGSVSMPGSLSVTGTTTLTGATTAGAFTAATINNVCNANQQTGADLGAKINTCIALGGGTEILVTAAGTISTQVLFNNINNMYLHCIGLKGGPVTLTDGIVGNPAEPAIKITGTSQHIKIEGCNGLGNGIAGVGGNGNFVSVLGTGATPADVQFINSGANSFKGNGKDGTGASMLAAGFYTSSVIDINVDFAAFGSDQQGVVFDGNTNHAQVMRSQFFTNIGPAIVTKGAPQHIIIGPWNDIEGNATNTSDFYIDFENCSYSCEFYDNWVEFNNGQMGFLANSGNGDWDVHDNIIIHGVSTGSPNASVSRAIVSGATVKFHFHDNAFQLQGSSLSGRVIELNGSTSAGKFIDHNVFEENATGSPTVSTAVIGFGAVSAHSAPLDISFNNFGGPFNNYFAAAIGIDLSNGTPTGATLIGNSFYNTSGTITTGINIAGSSVGTFVANTTKNGTVTTLINDSGTATNCIECSPTNISAPSGGSLNIKDNGGNLRFNITNGNANTFIRGNASGSTQIGAALTLGIGDATGTITSYGGTNTAGQGVCWIIGATSQKAETQAADANVLTVTPPAAVGTYRVSVPISVTSATAGVISYTVSWTDSSGNAQANVAGPLFQYGTAAPNTTFTTSAAGNYKGDMLIDVNAAAANIVVKWVGGGTSVAKVSAVIERCQ